MNGKGRGPEKGRNHSKFRDGWDAIFAKKKAEKPDPFMEELATKGLRAESAAIHYDNLNRFRKVLREKLQEKADAALEKTIKELGNQ